MQDLRPSLSLAAKDWLNALNQFETQGTAYVLVTVLRVEAPASARAGDKAVVTRSGEFFGWIGGGCAQPVVRKAIEEALDTGVPVTLRITPHAEDLPAQGVRQVPMACHSGGSVELFIEPHQPSTPLHIFGQTPVAQVLSDLASRVGIPVISVPLPSSQASSVTWAVIATQGQGDLLALRKAMEAGARQIWFIASARKWSKLQAELLEAGVSESSLRRVIAPAGLPIGARTPEEIALSVLAGAVAARRGVADAVVADVSPSLPVAPAMPRSCCGGGA
ncbi:MAG: hypothetical protein RLY30_451 [Pseudomonadota bacterium]